MPALCVTNDAALAERMQVLRGARRETQVLPRAHRRELPHRRAAGGGAQRQAQAPRRLDRGRQRNAAFYDAALRRAQLEEAVQTPHASLGVRHI